MSIQSNNKFLKAVSYDKFNVIEGYIDNLKSRYHIHLNIHDIVGLISIAPEMEKALGSYVYHNNSFCNYMKKNSENFEMCVKQKQRLCKHCKDINRPFYGSCYMGVEEVIFPVKWENTLIAIICVGQFCDDIKVTTQLLRQKARSYALDENQCVGRYFNVVTNVDFNIKEMYFDVGILCQHLLYIYMNHITQGRVNIDSKNYFIANVDSYKSTHIIANTIKFIKDNYNRELSLSLLAANSFCNASYLSHIFKEKTCVSISDYINQIRIEAAKQILDTTTKTITEIGFLVGYNDSNYFSRVFKKITSMTPKKYRNREI